MNRSFVREKLAEAQAGLEAADKAVWDIIHRFDLDPGHGNGRGVNSLFDLELQSLRSEVEEAKNYLGRTVETLSDVRNLRGKR